MRLVDTRLLPRMVTVTLLGVGVAFALGSRRVGAWVGAADVPLGVLLVFGRALLGGALEAAMVVAVPLGFVWAWHGASPSEGGGASPRQADRAALATVGVVLGVAVTLALLVSPRSPGATAQQLVEAGRRACVTAPPGRRIQVPLVGVAWLCLGDQPPRLEASLVRPEGTLRLGAASLALSEDLRAAQLEEVTLDVPANQGRPAVKARIQSTRLRGLPTWGQGSLGRHWGVLLGRLLVGWVLVAGFLWARRRWPHPPTLFVALLPVVAAALGTLWGLSAYLDRWPAWVEVLLAPAVVLALFLAGARLLWRRRLTESAGQGPSVGPGSS